MMKPLRIKNPRRKFAAARDENGVPHITADSWPSALYGLGYMHAVDRPTQMLFSRVVASGRSAELIADKPELLEMDRFFRRAGLYCNLAQEVDRLDDRTFACLTAYCEGANDGMKQSGRSLAMWATRFQPEPWNQQAVLLIGNLLNYGGLAIGQQQNERLLLELIQAGVDRHKLRELFHPLLESADFDLLRQIKISSRLSDEALELITDLPRLAGSNAWAVAPGRTAGGAALLASDPHLEINRLPAIWYEAVLQWDQGDYCLGATLPGCPLFAVARTRHLAWGVTYLKGDTSDFFIEDCRCYQGRWQYRRRNEWLDFEIREERIARKAGPDEWLNVYHNSLGTLEADPEERGPGCLLLTAWTGYAEGTGGSMATWLKLIGCHGTAEGMELVRQCPQPTLCWVFADTAGHIGSQASGWIPDRPAKYHGMLPIPAWDTANHWRGFLSSHVLPSIYDPPRGFVASANENVNRPGGPLLVTQPVPDYRRRRIDERLAALPAATLADMQALQYDVVSLQARELLAVFLPHIPPCELRQRLEQWNHAYDPSSSEATLFARLYRNVLLEIFGGDLREQGGFGWRRMLYLCSRAGFSMMVVTCLDRLLKRDHSLWWQGRDKGDLIRRAAEKVDVTQDEPWAVFNAFKFTNRFFEARFVGRALGAHTSDLPMRGCHATPFQGHLLRAATRETTFAPSYHLVADLSQPGAWTNMPGGPSESWFSRWYKSDIDRWYKGDYKYVAPPA